MISQMVSKIKKKKMTIVNKNFPKFKDETIYIKWNI